MKKIIQTLQQNLDIIDTRDRGKMQRIIRDLKTIRIRAERNVERQKDTMGCAISFFGTLLLFIIMFIYKITEWIGG